MGTFMGHASTGSFFFIFGLFVFCRATGVSMLSFLRTKDQYIRIPALFTILGGTIYMCGEAAGMIVSIGNIPSHIQHFIMAGWFIVGGVAQLLHMYRKLSGVGFYMFYPIMWIVLSIMFFAHPQPLESLNFGHKAMSILFLLLATVEALCLTVGNSMNNGHNVAQMTNLLSVDRGHPSLSSCPCRCGVRESHILPMYNNPIVYTTMLPVLEGFILMMLGVIDWGMALSFFQHDFMEVEWYSFSDYVTEEKEMDHAMEDMDMESMSAQQTFLLQLFAVFSFLLVLSYWLHYFDRQHRAKDPSIWRDEISFWVTSKPTDTMVEEMMQKCEEVENGTYIRSMPVQVVVSK